MIQQITGQMLEKILFAERTLAGNITSGGVVTELEFSNVQPGEYILNWMFRIESRGSDDAHIDVSSADGFVQRNIGVLNSFVDNDFQAPSLGGSKKFTVSTAGDITFTFVRNGTTPQIFSQGTFVQLLKVNNFETTTIWD